MSQDYDFAQSQVPNENRRGFWAMFVIMLGFTFFSASMWTGQQMGVGLSLGKFITAVLLSNIILGIYTSLLALMASETGLSVHLLARNSFGVKGSWLPSFLLGFTQVGWFGVGVAMFAFPVKTWLEAKGMHCPIWIPVLISGIAFTSSAYFGIKALAIISIVAVPAVAVGGGFSALKVFLDNADAWNTLCNYAPKAELAITLPAAVAMGVGSFISGGTCTPDFVRFANNKRTAISTTAIAFFIGNSLMFIFGAVGGMFYQKNDISEVMVIQGLLVPGIIVLGLNIWTTNDNALYTSGLGLANITGLPKKFMVLFNGALGTIFAVWLYNNFCGWLSMLNTTLPPIGAVLMADYFIFKRKSYLEKKEIPSKVINIIAVIAWAAGVATANFFKHGLTAINGMVVAVVVYTILMKLTSGKCCCCECKK